jgi:hypothetical protein
VRHVSANGFSIRTLQLSGEGEVNQILQVGVPRDEPLDERDELLAGEGGEARRGGHRLPT